MEVGKSLADVLWQNYVSVKEATLKKDIQSQIEELADLIYTILKEDEVTANINERAYITDILSEAIIKAGWASPDTRKRDVRGAIKGTKDAMRQAGYVKLAGDQYCPLFNFSESTPDMRFGYQLARDAMLEAGFRKVEL